VANGHGKKENQGTLCAVSLLMEWLPCVFCSNSLWIVTGKVATQMFWPRTWPAASDSICAAWYRLYSCRAVVHFRRSRVGASRNQLDSRSGWRFSGRRRTRSYVDGKFEIRELTDFNSYPRPLRVYRDLCFTCSNGWSNQGLLWQSNWNPTCTFEQLQTLGERLAEHTGWELTLPDSR